MLYALNTIALHPCLPPPPPFPLPLPNKKTKTPSTMTNPEHTISRDCGTTGPDQRHATGSSRSANPLIDRFAVFHELLPRPSASSCVAPRKKSRKGQEQKTDLALDHSADDPQKLQPAARNRHLAKAHIQGGDGRVEGDRRQPELECHLSQQINCQKTNCRPKRGRGRRGAFKFGMIYLPSP